MAMQFKKAQRKLSKLRLAIQGPSGSGKTYGALLLAKGLGGSIAVIDTEHGSASLYAGLDGMPEFDVLELEPPYSPERYIKAIQTAEEAGYEVIIIDSISNEWNGQGGCTDIQENIARSAKNKGNSFSSWADVTPRHRAFVEKILACKCHVVATLRTKSDYLVSDEGGRKKIEKVGLKPEQREGIDYEFTVVFEASVNSHTVVVSKDRTNLFFEPFRISEDTGKKLQQWLNSASFESAPRQTEAVAQPSSVEELAEDLWDEGEKTAELTQFQSVRADELLEALESADTAEQVDQIAKSLGELKLPKESPEYKNLVAAYRAAQKRVLG